MAEDKKPKKSQKPVDPVVPTVPVEPTVRIEFTEPVGVTFLRPIPMGDDGKPEYTTFRIYADDGDDISEVAAMLAKERKMKVTIADVFREFCSAQFREMRIKKAEEELRRLKRE